MLKLNKTLDGERCFLTHQGQRVGELPEAVADELIELEKQHSSMAMLLRMLAAGRNVKEKAAQFIAEHRLSNPLR